MFQHAENDLNPMIHNQGHQLIETHTVTQLTTVTASCKDEKENQQHQLLCRKKGEMKRVKRLKINNDLRTIRPQAKSKSFIVRGVKGNLNKYNNYVE